MDPDAPPQDAESQHPPSIMTLSESAKNCTTDTLTAVSRSNATTPRDASRNGALESTSCAELTPDDRERPARHVRGGSEGTIARPRNPTAPLSQAAGETCFSYALDRGQDKSVYASTSPLRAKPPANEPNSEGVPARIPEENEAYSANPAETEEVRSDLEHTRERESSRGDVCRGEAILSPADLGTHGTGRPKAPPVQETRRTEDVPATAEGMNDEDSSDDEHTSVPVSLSGPSHEVGSTSKIPLNRNHSSFRSGSSRRSHASPRRSTGSVDQIIRDSDNMGEEWITWEAYMAQHEGPRGIGGGAGEGGGRRRVSQPEQCMPQVTHQLRPLRTEQGDERQNRTANSPESIDESSPQYPLYGRRTRSSWEEHDDASDGDTNVDETQSSTLDRRDKVHRTLSDLEPLTLRSDVIGIKGVKSFSPTTLQVNHHRKMERVGVDKFNVSPQTGINFLVQKGLIENNPEGICRFLSSASGLSKRRLGEYFGKDNPDNQQVLSLFLTGLNLRGMSLDDALRKMVLTFRMPGEAQQIDRIMEKFSQRYHEENPGTFSCSETAYVLSFSLMMLNTDMYNRSQKDSERMTEDQFVGINRGIDQDGDLDPKLLRAMYRRLKEKEIRMDEGDMFESEVITFVAPVKSGWLRKKGARYVAPNKWKRHWFVLNNSVLYYFTSPQHQDGAPRCIIPLEHINVDKVGITDICLAKKGGGYMKSVKKMDDGVMVKGHHHSFQLRAETEADRNEWVRVLREEVPDTGDASGPGTNTPNTLNTAGSEFELRSSSIHGIPHDLTVTASASGSMRSLSATPVTSSAATPIGTPSDSGRRRSKLSSILDRTRRGVLEPALGSGMPPPMIRGWAMTKNTDKPDHQRFSRRYLALFRVADPVAKGVIYSFGNKWMCDRMVDQGVHTHHAMQDLNEVVEMQLRNGEGDGVRLIALQIVESKVKKKKEYIIIPEEERDFNLWVTNIRNSCPNSTQSIAADEFAGICTMLNNVPGSTPSASSSIVENNGSASDSVPDSVRLPPMHGRVEDNNSAIGVVSWGVEADASESPLAEEEGEGAGEEVGLEKVMEQGPPHARDVKGKSSDRDNCMDYERMLSDDTQLPARARSVELGRTETAPSAATEQEGGHEDGDGDGDGEEAPGENGGEKDGEEAPVQEEEDTGREEDAVGEQEVG